MPKLPIPRIPSDDFLMRDGPFGEWFAVHEGEWVELLPRRTFAEIREYQKFSQLSTDLEVLKPMDGDDTRQARADRREMQRLQAAAFDELCRFLAKRVMRWNWTGPTGQLIGDANDYYIDEKTGETLPCHKLTSPSDIEALDAAEIYYLLNVEQGDAPSERKDFLTDSPTTGSDSAPKEPGDASSSTARSLTKVG